MLVWPEGWTPGFGSQIVSGTERGDVMAVDFESLVQHEELQQLLEGADVTGTVRYAELTEAVELLQLDALEIDAVYRELEQRGIDVIEGEAEPAPPPLPPLSYETTTDALQLFL